MMIRTYTDLNSLPTLSERFEYLKLQGEVGRSTFGFDRYINQKFYRSIEWQKVRDEVIIRDQGCDLGDLDFGIRGRIVIHHMNPMLRITLDEALEDALNPEFLICASHNTHNAIHYSDASLLPRLPITRSRNDTNPWS